MKKPGIPEPPTVFVAGANQRLREHQLAIQASLEIITGRRGGRIAPLATDATQAEVIAKVNELLERLQG